VEPSEAIVENWRRQGMMGGAKAHYDGVVAFSQTDFTEDLNLAAPAGDHRRRPARPRTPHAITRARARP
jgi:hypothetical protein